MKFFNLFNKLNEDGFGTASPVPPVDPVLQQIQVLVAKLQDPRLKGILTQALNSGNQQPQQQQRPQVPAQPQQQAQPMQPQGLQQNPGAQQQVSSRQF